MSVVDNFIAALHSSGAVRLLLASGRPPVLTLDGLLEPIPGEALDRLSLEDMIHHMGGSAETGQHEFVYQAPTGPVDVTTRITDRLIQAIILPASGEVADPETAAAESGPPSPGEGSVAEVTPSADGDDAPTASPGAFQHTYAFGVSSVESDGGPEIEGSARVSGSDEPDPSDTSAVAGEPTLAIPDESHPSAADEHDPPRETPPAAPQRSRHHDIGGDVALETREDAPAMERLLLKMVEYGCSDLHVSAGNPPLFRKDGRITDLGAEPQLSATQARALLAGITPEKNRKEFEERNDTDFAYEIPSVARFRCNLFRDRNGMGGVFRQIPAEILTAEQLGLPAQLLELCGLKKGLILVTGPTGSGKSTTLAALIDHINRTRQDHIITIEDPIEFVHRNRQCLINQREVGEHTRSFKVALRAALREDPDIVLVGELRDLETVEIALETAETGHLVFGTLHTNTAPGTVSRLIDQFPSGQQAQIRTMLADTLKAVVAQTLCRKIGGGRVAALETLVVTTAVANLIREDKAFQIPSAMQTGRAQGMRTLNDALLELVREKIVTAEEAQVNAVDRGEFVNALSRIGIEVDQSSRVA